MKRIILTSIILAALVFTGCKREERGYDSTEHVELALSIVREGEFTPVPSDGTKSDADLQNNNDVNEYSLTIINTSSGETVKSWDRFADVPTVVTLEPAEYRVEAKSPGDKAVAWAQPKYAGSQTVTVTPGQTQSISITCRITNMMVTVRCTEAFLNEMNEDFTISVTSKDGVLIWEKPAVVAENSGFFDVAPLEIYVKGTRKTGGEINHYAYIDQVAAQDHHVLTVDAGETGYMDYTDGISIDYSVNGREEDINIGGLDENPVEDEDAVPEVSSTSIAEGAADVPVETSTVDITYTTAVEVADGASITLNGEACTASASGSKVTVSLPALTAETAYTLNIPVGAVTRAGAPDAAADAFTLHFTTAAAEQDEPEEPETSAITITATAGIDEPVTYSKSALPSEFSLTVEAPAGIANFVVDVKAEGLRDLLDGVLGSVPEEDRYTVDLANMDALKLGFWGALFGISDNSDVKGQTSKTFAIGAFLAAMPVGTNDLGISITDNDGETLSKTLTIIMTE